MSAKARIRPIFGWEGWDRAQIYNDQGQDISVTNSLWIIAFGNHGLVGLMSWMTALILPVLTLAKRIPICNWTHPAAALVAALSVVLMMYGLDCLVNAMINPVFALAAGGLSGLAVQKINRKRPRRPGSQKITT